MFQSMLCWIPVISTLITGLLVWIAKQQNFLLMESNRLTMESNKQAIKPYVSVGFEIYSKTRFPMPILSFVIQNTGKTTAKNIHLTHSEEDSCLKSIACFEHGVDSLHPNGKIEYPLFAMPGLETCKVVGHLIKHMKDTTISLSYEDDEGNISEHSQPSDISHFNDMPYTV